MKMTKGEKHNLKLGLLFISPWIVGFSVFVLYPFLASLYFSFCHYTLFQPPHWIGVYNYTKLLQDRVFWISLYNTLYYSALVVPFSLVISLGLALLLNAKVKGLVFFRLLFYLPSLVPMVALCILWLWIFNGEYGILNQQLANLGISQPPNWLSDPRFAKLALVFMAVWTLGQNVVIYLAALQEVPRVLMEAADIDGAGWHHKFRHVIIPAISPSILFNVLMGVITSFQVFAGPYIMTKGGPGRSTTFYVLYLYQKSFEDLNFGYASAMAWLLFLLILGLTLLGFKLSKQAVYYTD